MQDRVKNMCYHIVPIYYGDRPASTRGKPNESNDYYFKCYVSAEFMYRQANTIKELCTGCKKYEHVRPLTKDEIFKRFYKDKQRD